jgi:hypothetical protein
MKENIRLQPYGFVIFLVQIASIDYGESAEIHNKDYHPIGPAVHPGIVSAFITAKVGHLSPAPRGSMVFCL